MWPQLQNFVTILTKFDTIVTINQISSKLKTKTIILKISKKNKKVISKSTATIAIKTEAKEKEDEEGEARLFAGIVETPTSKSVIKYSLSKRRIMEILVRARITIIVGWKLRSFWDFEKKHRQEKINEEEGKTKEKTMKVP